MRLKIIVFLLLLVVVPAFSADKFQTEYRYALSGIGFSQQKITYLSPLYYQGVSLVTSRGKVKLSEDRMVSSLYETNLDLNYKNPNSYFYSLGFDYYYNSNFRLRWENYPDNIPDLFVGFGYWLDAEFYAKTSNSNNPCYYNLNNMLTFSFCCEKKFERVKLSYEFNIPVAGIYSASEYSSGLPYFLSEKDASFFQAFHLGSFGKNFQMENKFNVDLKLKTKKGFRTYRLQYAIANDQFLLNGNCKRNVFHLFKLGYLFNTVNYEH